AERVADDADVRAALREQAQGEGRLASRPAPAPKEKKEEWAAERRKFEDYFEFEEPARTLPSHRILALRRGEEGGFLRVTLEVDGESALGRVRGRIVRNRQAALARDLETALADAYDRLLAPSIEAEVRVALKERA